MSNEKDRLMKKRQLLVKHEMDKRMAELIRFSKSFKVWLRCYDLIPGMLYSRSAS